MSIGPHPQMTEAMEHLQKFTSTLEDQLRLRTGESFTATDETETVEATVNADSVLTRLHIEDGLLRLGAETVEQRINEALRIAQSEVDLALEAQQEHLVHKLNEIAGSLTKLLEQ